MNEMKKENGCVANRRRRIAAMCLAVMVVVAMSVTAFATEGGKTVSYDDVKPIVTSLTSQISVANIVGILSAFIGAAIGLVFMWWAIRKGASIMMKAFKKGKISV